MIWNHHTTYIFVSFKGGNVIGSPLKFYILIKGLFILLSEVVKLVMEGKGPHFVENCFPRI